MRITTRINDYTVRTSTSVDGLSYTIETIDWQKQIISNVWDYGDDQAATKKHNEIVESLRRK